LSEVAFWGNLILFFSKKIISLTNLISFFPREIVHFLLKKLFPFSLEIFFLKRNVFEDNILSPSPWRKSYFGVI